MRDNRFALISMGRPFVPTMATPDGTIDKDARLQLIYLYLLAGAGIPATVYPLTITFSRAAMWSIAVSRASMMSITVTKEN